MNYHPTHPWYYVLGGGILPLKEIWQDAIESERQGYNRVTIEKARGNNQKLRTLKDIHFDRLKSDISRYRECALELHRFRKAKSEDKPPLCEDVHVNLSLKTSHIWGEFANLCHIESLLSYQPDLFDMEQFNHE